MCLVCFNRNGSLQDFLTSVDLDMQSVYSHLLPVLSVFQKNKEMWIHQSAESDNTDKYSVQLSNQGTICLSGGQTCMMPPGPMHCLKRMRPTRGSTAERGSSSSWMCAPEYAALANAKRAFCPPAHHKIRGL